MVGFKWIGAIICLALLASCAAPPALPPLPGPEPQASSVWPSDTKPLPAPIERAASRWVAVRWSELPGFADDALHEAWNAWIKSCERPAPAFVALCPQVRRLSIATADEQRAWMMTKLRPYRVEPLSGQTQGLLTAYFEPVFEAVRQPDATHQVALYRPPTQLRKPWFTRQEIDTLAQARTALREHEIAYLTNPLDALILQIQGSGRLRISESDGTVRTVRLSFAGTNEQPYRSVGAWLLNQDGGSWRDASWPGIKAWLAQNPQRENELLWSNPRVVFFKEEALTELDANAGPRGAQGVALTAGRSIAVDPRSVPYGTPAWLVSHGPTHHMQKLVLAQDTGSAIVGAVRADYFAGTGAQAGEFAGRLKQPLQLWVLWPK